MSSHLDTSVYHDTSGQNRGPTLKEEPVVPLERNLYGHPFARLLWKRRIFSCLYTWMTKNGWKEPKPQSYGEEIDDIGKVNANRTKASLKNTEKCSNHESPMEQLKSYLVGRIRPQKQSLGLLTWTVMRRNVWKDIANWRIKRLSNCVRSLHHVFWKNWKRWQTCQKYALKLS